MFKKQSSIVGMNISIQKPKQSLNKSFLKVRPSREHIEQFKANLVQMLEHANQTESEEYHKNLVADFFKNTYYSPTYFINTKGATDLVIHTGKDATTPVAVLIEAKKPSNKSEMPTLANLNAKSMQELVLYYLRERIAQKNLEIKHLVVTNLYEWFVFDATVFEKAFAQNKQLVQQFSDFSSGRLAGTSTDFFYREIAAPALASAALTVTHFAITDYDQPLRNAERSDDNKLIALYKLFSPEHLLKLPFANDSNSLNKEFYSELLHLIGLTETKEKGKKVIERKAEGERHNGALLENAMRQVKATQKLSYLPNAHQFGRTTEEQLFAISLELCITWMNRVLFLKLLEAQLINYHKGDSSFAFLNKERIGDYDELQSLFFDVLAQRPEERESDVQKVFSKVPYLNSSLFEPTELERATIMVSNLRDEQTLPILSSTVLKNTTGKKRVGDLSALEYLFEFLNAYDFSSEGTEAIQEGNRTLINASVLGLIFEKINGYKDGSFFTPAFITMYMCRETIRRAVVQKFNEVKGWACESFDDLYDKIEDRTEANAIVNSLKICDPAVGSGHFLVSALNELIAIKSELKILSDRTGKRLKEYRVEVENDELVVTDDDGDLFEYNPTSIESQRVQETLFHEKQTIIENCLFGVDINPNSVKICRLRLWIELLKNAYYKADNELETLPNIDINIKCGNSLISRFGLDSTIREALKGKKKGWTIEKYRAAIRTYQNAESKEQKREMETLIGDIKSELRTEISSSDNRVKKLTAKNAELYALVNQEELFEVSKAELKERKEHQKKLEEEIANLTEQIEDIRSNKIYENAFEWRFEFPEVLNDDGDFVGFDVVIGNPPYISHDKIDIRNYLKEHYECFEAFADLYCYFFELGIQVTKEKGTLNLITSNSFLRAEYGRPLRELFNRNGQFSYLLNIEDAQIFEDAIVNTVIADFQKGYKNLRSIIVNQAYGLKENFRDFIANNFFEYSFEDFDTQSWNLSKPDYLIVGRKIKNAGRTLEDLGTKIRLGIATGSNEAFVIDKETASTLIEKDSDSRELIKPVIRGRDISRYSYVQSKYILLTKNGVDVQEDYPAIYDYLDKFGENFKKRGAKGKHWTNLRACSFFDDFKESKIVWIELSDTNKFAISNEEVYLLNSAYFLLPPKGISIHFLLGLLNSGLIKFYLGLIANTSGVGTTRWINIYVKEFPVSRNANLELEVSSIVSQILTIKKEDPNADTSALEKEIDALVYTLYGLTEEEIAIVEGTGGKS